MVKITGITKGSPAARAGIKRGESLKAFDGFLYRDALDYIYYDSAERFSVTIGDAKGKERTLRIDKKSDIPLGIELEASEFEIIPCRNKCLFCFVNQCPKGMRNTLYVKDDDYRLSFISGNYVTLSNVNNEDIQRIIRLKLSPLYISVHCFDKKLKKKLCANPRSAELFSVIDSLAAGGITLHTQIVMIEGLNDKAALDKTVRELYARYPSVKSLAIVPVGLTAHRDNLYPIKPISKECATRTIEEIHAFNQQVIKEQGEGFVWCADELYLIAGKPIPEYSYYGTFPQIENGVGLVAEFVYDMESELSYIDRLRGNYTLVTGKAFEPLLKQAAATLEHRYGIELEVKGIANEFFGTTVTVAGLVTGEDIVKQLKGKIKYKDIIIPHTMLKEFETVFLDGISVAELERELGCTIHVARGGDGLVKILAREQFGAYGDNT